MDFRNKVATMCVGKGKGFVIVCNSQMLSFV